MLASWNLLLAISRKCKASVMELVDMTDSKSVAAMRGGSSPPTGTTLQVQNVLRCSGSQ